MLLKALMNPLQERRERERGREKGGGGGGGRMKIEQMQVYIEQLKVEEKIH